MRKPFKLPKREMLAKYADKKITMHDLYETYGDQFKNFDSFAQSAYQRGITRENARKYTKGVNYRTHAKLETEVKIPKLPISKRIFVLLTGELRHAG